MYLQFYLNNPNIQYFLHTQNITRYNLCTCTFIFIRILQLWVALFDVTILRPLLAEHFEGPRPVLTGFPIFLGSYAPPPHLNVITQTLFVYLQIINSLLMFDSHTMQLDCNSRFLGPLLILYLPSILFKNHPVFRLPSYPSDL